MIENCDALRAFLRPGLKSLTFLIRRFIVGCKNMANYSIKFGKRKIDGPSIRGKWTKLISKLKENGIICIEPSMQNSEMDVGTQSSDELNN